MFKSFKRTFTPAAVADVISGVNYDITHFASNVTGASWALSNTATTDELAHRVSIRNDSATDHSAKTVTITGTDADGQTISEVRNLPGASAVVSTILFFKTINTPLVPSATIGADTMDIGIEAAFTSQAFPSGTYYGNLNVGTEVTGVIIYGIDHNFDDVQTEASSSWNWLNNAADNIADSTSVDFATIRPKAVRLRVSAYDSTATIKTTLGQSYN